MTAIPVSHIGREQAQTSVQLHHFSSEKEGNASDPSISSFNHKRFLTNKGYCYLMIIFIAFSLSLFISTRLSNIHPLFTWVFWLFLVFLLLLSLWVFTSDPGIVMETIGLNREGLTCPSCHTFVPNYIECAHCTLCNVCVEGWSHHCRYLGKCVGKKNRALFVCFISLIILMYAYIAGCLIASASSNSG